MMNRRSWLKRSAAGSSAIALSAYAPLVIPGERKILVNEDEYLRLHWNENPYGPSKQALDAANRALIESNHYPDDRIDALKAKLASRYELNTGQVMLTVGSTEALGLIGQYAAIKGGNVLMSDSSFPTIGIYAQRYGADVHTVPISDNNQIDLRGILGAIDDDTRVIFICNPNNPTSTDLARADLVSFCEAVPKRVLICMDEAYIQYSRDGEQGSLVGHLDKIPNMVICRTFSKAYGLAGMRIGVALGPAAVISELSARRPGFDFASNRISVEAASAALDDDAHIDMIIRQNELGRQLVYDAFDKWGVRYARSATNFIYASSERFHSDVIARLRTDHKMLITKWPSMTDQLRISVGRPEWMERFIDASGKYLI